MADTFRMTYNPTVLRQFKQLNRDYGERVQNLTWLWRQRSKGAGIETILSDNARAIMFGRGQRQWPKATPKHIERKAKVGQSTATLHMTERLTQAFTIPGSADNISFGDAQNFYYGVNAENFRGFGGWSYPEIHNSIGDRRGVVRKFVYFLPATVRRLRVWFRSSFENEMRAMALRTQQRGLKVKLGAAA